MSSDHLAGVIDAAAAAAERDGSTVRRLALLGPLEYDRAREAEAKGLGVRVAVLDRLVDAARARTAPTPEAGSGSGSPLEIADPEPWPAPVDGAALLDELARELAGLVVMAPEAAAAAALWVAFTHALDAAPFAPRLLVKSPEKRCGKTTLLDALTEVCRRALPASNITAPALFRTIEKVRPTLLLDEADTFVRGNEELRGLVNSGHRRSHAFVVRTVEVDGDFEPRKFSTWCAMAIAGIGGLHATVEDRSVVVELRRKLPAERVARLDEPARARLRVLARKLRRWAEDHLPLLGAAAPSAPSELHDRAADNWRPLLAIADVAGGAWPTRARDAARKLAGCGEKGSARVLLLGDLREVFAERGDPEWMASRELLERLARLEERPWAEWSKGRPITSQALSRLLEEFRVHSSHNTDRSARGYRREAFADAWARYLPPSADGEGPSNRPSVQDARPARVSSAKATVRDGAAPDGSSTAPKPRGCSLPDGWTIREPAAAGEVEELRL